MIIRTPYGKVMFDVFALAMAAQGFSVVVQDCRGRFGSTGQQTFGAKEDLDGAATFGWLTEHCAEWFDPKRVVMWGISYLGIVQWATVTGLARQQRRPTGGSSEEESDCFKGSDSDGEGSADADGQEGTPPMRLVAIAPIMSGSRLFDVLFNSGVLNVDFYLRYTWLMTSMNSAWGFLRVLAKEKFFDMMMRRHVQDAEGIRRLHEKLGVARVFNYNPWPRSGFWQQRDYSAAAADAPPAFVATGWHDIFLECSIRDYEAVVEQRGPGCGARLLVGPWHHLEWPSEAVRGSIEFLQQRVGLAPQDELAKPVRLWVMGRRSKDGEWQDFESWPPPQAVERLVTLGFRSLNFCDITEVAARVTDARRSLFVYDPRDPTPMLGGSIFHKSMAGEFEQSLLESRQDTVCFDSPPLEASTVVVGRARVRLSVRASQPFFDICVRLLDVHPDGSSYNVCDGIFRRTRKGLDQRRASLQKDSSRPASCELNDPAESLQNDPSRPSSGFGPDIAKGTGTGPAEVVEIAFWATAKRFEVGHRIRLLVAGSSFPRLARNFHDEGQAADDKPFYVEPCKIEVLHTAKSPSELLLPVVEHRPQRSRMLLAGAARRRQPSGRRCSLPPLKAHAEEAAGVLGPSWPRLMGSTAQAVWHSEGCAGEIDCAGEVPQVETGKPGTAGVAELRRRVFC